MDGVTHIIVATHNRADLLRRTLAHIAARTETPHVVTVIDDGSNDGTSELLAGLGIECVRRPRRRGIAANIRDLRRIARSSPFVFTDDDVLCPDVRPDWLARLLSGMDDVPGLGVLALNNPQDTAQNTRRKLGVQGDVTMCRNVGATFALIRRKVVRDVTVKDGLQSPFKQFCRDAGNAGYGVGYLTSTYCQHIGTVSKRLGVDLSSDLRRVAPVNDRTLQPPEECIE